MKTTSLSYVLIATVWIASSARAQEATPRQELHGFGGWAYGKTSTNNYQAGDPEGNYQRGSFALNLSARPAPRLAIIGQVFWHQEEERIESEVDYAFAEWTVSDVLRLRAGKVKQPFGIYTEVFDVGTLRPFLGLPSAVYGPVGFVAEGYQGLGLRGQRAYGSDWNLAYDFYGGGILLEEAKRPINFLVNTGADAVEEEHEATRNLLGTRLVLATPVAGLSIGGSAYSGQQEELGKDVRHSAVGAQAEYVTDVVWLRGELAHQAEGDLITADAVYAEAGYFITRQWQASGLYDRVTVQLPGADISRAPSLTRHREVAVGLNRWFTPDFVLKASLHAVRGNRIAGPLPDALAAVIAAGRLNKSTRLFQVGAQFSF